MVSGGWWGWGGLGDRLICVLLTQFSCFFFNGDRYYVYVFTIANFCEKIWHAALFSDITLRSNVRHFKQLTSHFYVAFELA